VVPDCLFGGQATVWSSKGRTARTCEHTAALNANLADAAASVSPLPRQAGIPGRRMTWSRHVHDGELSSSSVIPRQCGDTCFARFGVVAHPIARRQVSQDAQQCIEEDCNEKPAIEHGMQAYMRRA
jgi:hypothetical protein